MINDKKQEVLNILEIGIKKGKKAKKKKKFINSNIIVLALLIVTFTVSVNVSNTFATSMSGIPVIGKIVDFIQIGSGYEEVAKRGLFSAGDTIYKDEKLEVSVEGYYFSDNNVNVIIRFDGDELENISYNYKNINIYDAEMVEIEEYSASYGNIEVVNDYALSEFVFNKKVCALPEDIIIELGLIINYSNDTEQVLENKNKKIYEDLVIKLHKNVVDENIEISIDKSIEDNDIKLEVNSLIITPTTMDLTISSESDSIVFYGFKSIYFKSKDKSYYPISNGVTKAGDAYYFESAYFDDYDNLTLVIDGIYALPKENSTIIVDLEKREIIKNVGDYLVITYMYETEEHFYIHLKNTGGPKIEFATYNGQHFAERAMSSNFVWFESKLKMEKKYIVDSKVEIDFWRFENEIEFYKEIIIKD